MSLGSRKKHLENFFQFVRCVLIPDAALTFSFHPKVAEITKRRQRRLFKSDRVNGRLSAIDGVIHIWLIWVGPAANGLLPSAIYIPSFSPPTSHSSAESPSSSGSSISVPKSSSSGPFSLSSLFFFNSLFHQPNSNIKLCQAPCPTAACWGFFGVFFYLKVRTG